MLELDLIEQGHLSVTPAKKSRPARYDGGDPIVALMLGKHARPRNEEGKQEAAQAFFQPAFQNQE